MNKIIQIMRSVMEAVRQGHMTVPGVSPLRFVVKEDLCEKATLELMLQIETEPVVCLAMGRTF